MKAGVAADHKPAAADTGAGVPALRAAVATAPIVRRTTGAGRARSGPGNSREAVLRRYRLGGLVAAHSRFPPPRGTDSRAPARGDAATLLWCTNVPNLTQPRDCSVSEDQSAGHARSRPASESGTITGMTLWPTLAHQLDMTSGIRRTRVGQGSPRTPTRSGVRGLSIQIRCERRRHKQPASSRQSRRR